MNNSASLLEINAPSSFNSLNKLNAPPTLGPPNGSGPGPLFPLQPPGGAGDRAGDVPGDSFFVLLLPRGDLLLPRGPTGPLRMSCAYSSSELMSSASSLLSAESEFSSALPVLSLARRSLRSGSLLKLSEALERVGETLASDTESGASLSMVADRPCSESDSLCFLKKRRGFIVGSVYDAEYN